MTESSTCRAPDRDQPKLVCGYPLPCPHHTAIIDPGKHEVTIPVAVGANVFMRVNEIADAIKEPGCITCGRRDPTTRKRLPEGQRPDGTRLHLSGAPVFACDGCARSSAHRAGLTYVEGT